MTTVLCCFILFCFFVLFCFVFIFVLFCCFILLFCFVLFLFCLFCFVFLVKLGGSRLTYWDLDVSSSFFLTMSASSSTCLIGCLPNLVRSMYGCMATKLIRPGSFGVTGVKKVNHGKTMKTALIQNLIIPPCRQ